MAKSRQGELLFYKSAVCNWGGLGGGDNKAVTKAVVQRHAAKVVPCKVCAVLFYVKERQCELALKGIEHVFAVAAVGGNDVFLRAVTGEEGVGVGIDIALKNKAQGAIGIRHLPFTGVYNTAGTGAKLLFKYVCGCAAAKEKEAVLRINAPFVKFFLGPILANKPWEVKPGENMPVTKL